MKNILIVILFSGYASFSYCQSLAVNTDGSTAHSSAILDVKSTNKGILIPRMTKAQRNAIVSPSAGLLVFQNAPDSSGFYYYTGSGWDWINNPNPPKTWSINGNQGTDPMVNFLGTTDNKDLSFRTNNFELMRLNADAHVGIANGYPRYALDISYNAAAISYCPNNGLRVKSPFYNINCNHGFVMGYKDGTLPNASDAILWNYGQGGPNPKIIFGLGDYEMMRLNDYGFLGLGQQDPKYTLDINAGIAAVFPCSRNGIRINKPFYSSDCDNGIFYGYDKSTIDQNSSIWNFSGDLATSLRIGFGSDFDGITGEAMRVRPNGWGVGIGTPTPQAMVHVQNKTGVGVFNGYMVSSPLLPSDGWGFFAGLNSSSLYYNEAMLWNYQQAGIRFGTNNIEAMFLDEYGRLGIGANIPQEKLHVAGIIRSTALAGTGDKLITANVDGNLTIFAAGNEGDVLTNSGGLPVWQAVQNWKRSGNSGTSPVSDFIGTTDAADLVFKTNSQEALRIGADGKVSIGGGYPAKQFEVAGPASAIPVAMVIANKGGFGPSSLEFVSDYGSVSQWRPGYIRSNDIGGFTGSVEIYTNGTGSGNLYGSVKGLEVRNGITFTATGSVSSFSDERLKSNIVPFSSGLDIIKKINPVMFTYNELSPFTTSQQQIGVVAQEIELIAPYMVDQVQTDKIDDLRTVNNQAYVYLLINAVKEQDEKIVLLQKKLEEQQKLIDILINREKKMNEN